VQLTLTTDRHRFSFRFQHRHQFYYKSRASSSVSNFSVRPHAVAAHWNLQVATVRRRYALHAVFGMVAKGAYPETGCVGYVASGMIPVFFYARLWRRSGVMNDIEFSEIRYSGRPAAFLRGFRALYLGIPINCIILGWVNKAMVDILMLILGVTKVQALIIVICMITRYRGISTLSALGRSGHRHVPVRHTKCRW
jgi:hypothetical protein